MASSAPLRRRILTARSRPETARNAEYRQRRVANLDRLWGDSRVMGYAIPQPPPPDPSPSPGPGPGPSLSPTLDPARSRSRSPASSSSFGDIELPRADHSSPTDQRDIIDESDDHVQLINYDGFMEMAMDMSSNNGDEPIAVDDLDFSDMKSELSTDTIARILDGAWPNDVAIAELVELFSSLRPLDAEAIDPLLVDRPPVNSAVIQLLASGSQQQDQGLLLLVPIRCGAHWTLVVLRAADKSVRYYNSMPNYTMPNLAARIDQVRQGLIRGLDYNIVDTVSAGTLSCPQQTNTDDCGVAVIVNGIYNLASRPLSSTINCDYGICRRVLAVMLMDKDELDDNLDLSLSLVPPELAEEPTVNIGTAEPRPANLSASEYHDWVCTERQRLVVYMRSTIDSLVDFSSRCRSHSILVAEIVSVLESLTSERDVTAGQELDMELDKLNTAIEQVRALRWVNQAAKSALKKQLKVVQKRADLCTAYRMRLEVLIHRYKTDLDGLEVMIRDVGALVDGLKQNCEME
ncbi:Ulp1 protease family protein [Fusarium austroafricanum]|uniref:Ulp1 protease family protein n=1 Tax=Fusarium austroafricanum TaxID=2364996 RepID=A0A8H4K949_9HYPO|nr:Ulp1 protease family protein [Fusarium austroafricanum]